MGNVAASATHEATPPYTNGIRSWSFNRRWADAGAGEEPVIFIARLLYRSTWFCILVFGFQVRDLSTFETSALITWWWTWRSWSGPRLVWQRTDWRQGTFPAGSSFSSLSVQDDGIALNKSNFSRNREISTSRTTTKSETSEIFFQINKKEGQQQFDEHRLQSTQTTIRQNFLNL